MSTPIMYAGESKNLIFNIVDSNGNPKNLNGATFVWSLDINNLTKSSPSPDIIVLDSVNGKVQITLQPSDTNGVYGIRKQELKVTDSNGNISYAKNLDMIQILTPPI